MKKEPLAMIQFVSGVGAEKVVHIVRHNRGIGYGIYIECGNCEMDIDRILDDPSAHEESCNKNQD